MCRGLGSLAVKEPKPLAPMHWIDVKGRRVKTIEELEAAMAEADKVEVKDNEIVKQAVDPLTPEQRAAVNKKMAAPIAEQPVSMQMLTTLMGTPTVPVRYRESPTGAADMMAAVITGAELGVAPMASIRQLYLINGQASMMAQLMAGLVFRAGHRISYTVDTEAERVTAYAYRISPVSGDYENVGQWTFGKDDAELADLHEKTTYVSYPYLMYAARATSALCRLYFPEVVAGVGYVPDEIGIDVPPEGLLAEADVVVDDEQIAMSEAVDDVIEVLDAEEVVET